MRQRELQELVETCLHPDCEFNHLRNGFTKVVSEVERLRVLLKSAIYFTDCIWCGAVYVDASKRHAYHGDRCPVFTLEGNVK